MSSNVIGAPPLRGEDESAIDRRVDARNRRGDLGALEPWISLCLPG